MEQAQVYVVDVGKSKVYFQDKFIDYIDLIKVKFCHSCRFYCVI